MKKYRAAVIGCGRIGCEFDDNISRRGNLIYTHAGTYYRSPYYNLVSLCDIDESKANKYAKKYSTIPETDYKKMLERHAPDVVSVCTGPESHHEIIRECVRFGVQAIYCEKPINTSVSVAKKTIKMCEKSGTILMVNHMRRFSEFHRLFAESLQQGKYGKVVAASAGYSGGIYNSGTHLVDLLRLYFGKIKSVSAHFSLNINATKEDPNLDAFIQFEKPIRASIYGHALPGIFDLDITTDKFRFHINAAALFNDQPFLEVESREKNNYFKGSSKFTRETEACSEILNLYSNTNNNYMLNGAAHLAKILNGTENQVLSTGQDALDALVVLKAMHTSATNHAQPTFI